MYEKFYGFKERPFNVSPNRKFFFASEKHLEALNILIYTINERKGFAVITGEIGSGKTTIWHTLLGRLNSATRVALITNTYLTPKQIIAAILDDLEVPFKDAWPKHKLLRLLNNYLIEQALLNFNVVVVIDEAQNLSVKVLEEVRMLSNLETDREKLLQIVLMGQPELRDKLKEKELEQLRQRIALYYHIYPLNAQETEAYVNHRLNVAGFNGGRELFTREALARIYFYSQGVPRLINTICDQALLTGFVRESSLITEGIIEEVSTDLNLLSPQS